MADKTDPTANNHKITNLIPRFYRSDANKKFLHATIDQLTQTGTVTKINAFIGRQNSKASTGDDIFLSAPSKSRQNYQLEPGFVIKDSVNNTSFFKDYQDYINQIKIFGGNTSNHSRLNNQEFYSWDPHICWDKFVNFQNYYWLPYGPDIIKIYGKQKGIISTYTVRVESQLGNYAYIFTPDNLTRNPNIKLYKGLTYKFEINSPGNPFAIKIARTLGLYDLYTNYSLDANVIEKGVITFTVPFDAPDYLYYVSTNDLDLGGTFQILSIDENSSINVEEEIVGKKTYTLSNGTPLSNGMKVSFGGKVTPNSYSTGQYYVEGVGAAIKLIAESDLELISEYTDNVAVLFDTTPFDKMPFGDATSFPKQLDYIVINRSSQDRNPWSRYNRWFHKDVVESSAAYNNKVPALDQELRAVRPIIEFEANLKLFNFGTSAIANIDLVDTFTEDVFSTVEGSLGYNIDGIDVVNGMRILFTADNDILVKNNIYKVEMINVISPERKIVFQSDNAINLNTSVITFTTQHFLTSKDSLLYSPNSNDQIQGLVNQQIYYVKVLDDFSINLFLDEDLTQAVKLLSSSSGEHVFEVYSKKRRQIHLQLETEPVVGDVALVKRGISGQGTMFWFDGEIWSTGQNKSSVNQHPLFDVFDNSGNSFGDYSEYNGSSFSGTKLFSYKVGYGSNDKILGFPLSYKNISNIGDIVFNFNLATDEFQYKTGINLNYKSINVGYLVKVEGNKKTFVNGWKKCQVSDSQAALRIYKNSEKVNNFEIDIFDNISQLDDLLIKIYVNNKRLDKSKWSIQDGVVYKTVILENNIEKSDILTIKAYSKQPINNNGYYEIPVNMQNNPLNNNLIDFTLGEVIDHVDSIVENNLNFVGEYPGSGNLRDLGDVSSYGTKFVQHSGPISLSLYHITSQSNNIIRAIEKARDDYNKFKRNFVTTAENLGIDTDPVSMVDLILQKINKDKKTTFPYYFSDMVPYGAKIRTEFTVLDYRSKSYPLSNAFNLDELSNKAVLVYRNNEQLLYGHQYTFNNEGFVVISSELNEGDIIVIHEYENTNGAFVPPTPSKLGLWPTFDPKMYVDNTYLTPRTMIQGHDGSIILAYGDYRDDLIIELEKRIYNNIKVNYDSSIFDIFDIIPGYNRKTDYSLQEFNEILAPSFYKWTVYIDRDFTKPLSYDRTNSMTFNYRGLSAPDGRETPGFWRGVYRWLLDTDRPNLCPWEMLGFFDEPSWWQDVYGPAPYTSDNLILWNDLADGIVREPKLPLVRLEKFKRPYLKEHIPVDNQGNILSPLMSGLSTGLITPTTSGDFIFGDVSPIETTWRRSSHYPFSVLIAAMLMQPAKYFGILLDRSRIVRNIAGQLIYKDTGLRVDPRSVLVPSIYTSKTDVKTAGIINYVVDSILSDDLLSYDQYQYDLSNITANLSYRIGAFTSKEKFNLLLDSKNPDASGSVFIPQDDYDIILNSSTPIKKITYSGVIITKLNDGYEIKGYSKTQPYFKYYQWTRSGININVGGISESFTIWTPGSQYYTGKIVQYNNKFYRVKSVHVASDLFETKYYEFLGDLPIIGGRNALFRTEWDKSEELILPYSSKLGKIQDVVDFLLSYGEWLKDQGFVFDDFNSELGAVTNWETSAKEFLFWTTQNWSSGQDKWSEWIPNELVFFGSIVKFNGDYYRAIRNVSASLIFDESGFEKLSGLSSVGSSVISLSPAASKLTFSLGLTVVDDIRNNFYDYEILKVEGTPLEPNFLNFYRENNEVSYSPQSVDGIYCASFYLVQKEQVVLFNNSTMFNDTIYHLSSGYRQERIKVSGYVSTNWNGSFDAPGFIFDQAKIQDWTEWKDYALGDIVKYKEFYYTANKFISGTNEFENENWVKLDKKPTPQLLPNWSYKASQFTDFYSLDSDNFDPNQQQMAQHLIGYQKRQYLSNIIKDDVSEFKFYQGMIGEKGTQNVLNKLFDVLSAQNKESVTFYEEWALRGGQYGANAAYENIEFILDQSKFNNNPQGFELVDKSDPIKKDFIIRQNPYDVYLTPIGYDSKPWPALTHYESYLRSAGYVRIDEVNSAISNIDQIIDLDISQFKNGDYIWCGFEVNGWNVYRFSDSTIKVTNVELIDNKLVFEFNKLVPFLVNSYIGISIVEYIKGGISNIENLSSIIGFHKIVEISFNKATVETPEDVVVPEEFSDQDKILVFELRSQRAKSIDELGNLIPRDLLNGELAWTDNNGKNQWGVWKNNPVYSTVKEIEKGDTTYKTTLTGVSWENGQNVITVNSTVGLYPQLTLTLSGNESASLPLNTVILEIESPTSLLISSYTQGSLSNGTLIARAENINHGRQVVIGGNSNVIAVSNRFGDVSIYRKSKTDWINIQNLSPPAISTESNTPKTFTGDVLEFSFNEEWLVSGVPLASNADIPVGWSSLNVYSDNSVVVSGDSYYRNIQASITITGCSKFQNKFFTDTQLPNSLSPGMRIKFITATFGGVNTNVLYSIDAILSSYEFTLKTISGQQVVVTIPPGSSETEILRGAMDMDWAAPVTDGTSWERLFYRPIYKSGQMLGNQYDFHGALSLYKREPYGPYTYIDTILSPEVSLGEQFGSAVTFGGNTLFVAAKGYNSGKGRVYQLKYQKLIQSISLYDPVDSFGTTVNLTNISGITPGMYIQGAGFTSEQKVISVINTSNSAFVRQIALSLINKTYPAEVTSTTRWTVYENEELFIKDARGMPDINGFSVYLKITGPTTGQLYLDSQYQNPFDATGLSGSYITGTGILTPIGTKEIVLSKIYKSSPAIVETNINWFLGENEELFIKDAQGMDDINGIPVYLKIINSTSGQLYLDKDFTKPLDTTNFGTYTERTGKLSGFVGTGIIVSDVPNSTPSGRLEFYTYGWTYHNEVIENPANETNNFGSIVSVSKDESILVITSSILYDTVNVYIYKKVLGKYKLYQTLSGTDDYFGESVAISHDGTYIAVSSTRYNGTRQNQGCVDVYKQEGNQYSKYQRIVSRNSERNQLFGSIIKFMNDYKTLAIYSRYADTFDRITFDDKVTFDSNTTTFSLRKVDSGRIDIYDCYSAKWIYSESLENPLEPNNGYEYKIAVSDNNILFSVANASSYTTIDNNDTIFDDGKTNFIDPDDKNYGRVFNYGKTPESYSWNLIHHGTERIDASKVKQAFLYNRVSNKLITYIDVIDPSQGKIPGVADQEISYKTFYDPATYTKGIAGVNVDEGSEWTKSQVGKLWWDLRTTKFLESYDDDVVYRNSTWNTLFPMASVDVYEWIETELLPSEWDELSNTEAGLTEDISGQSLYGDEVYSVVRKYDNISKTFVETYYYWVKNKKTVPFINGRNISAESVSNLISNPRGSGYAYLALTGPNSFSLVNVDKLLEDKNIVLSVEYWMTDKIDQNIHTEWKLVSIDGKSDIPNTIENKWVDSLCGRDEQNRVVPDINLPPKLKYGIENRPRQGMFVNRFEALKQIIEEANRTLIKYHIVGEKDISALEEYDVAPTENSGLYDTIVDTEYELRFASVGTYINPVINPIIENGKIIGVDIINKGAGYIIPPYIDIFGDGVGAILRGIVNESGQLSGVTVISSGEGYTVKSTSLSVRPFAVLVNSDSQANNSWSIYSYDVSTRTWSRTKTQSYDTRDYWEYVDWYESGYNQYTAFDYSIDTLLDLITLEAEVGELVKVRTTNTNNWLLFEKYRDSVSTDWTEKYRIVGSQNGTIQFKSGLYKFDDTIYGYDSTLYDSIPYDNVAIKELRNILVALKNDILTDDLKPEYLSLFFTSVRYAMSEQLYLDWAFKTSFVKAQHNVGELYQSINYNNDNLTNFNDYISEVKPYRTKVREYVSSYTKVENTQTTITDFDLPTVYDGEFTPIFAAVVNGKIEANNPEILEYPWKHWLDNVGFSVVDIKVFDGGSGYKSPPTVEIISDSGTGATAKAYVSNGKVYRIMLLNSGSNYLSAPSVVLNGGLSETGVPAKVVAIIGNSLVRSNDIKIKYDRTTSSTLLTELNETETFIGSGFKKQFILKWAPDIRIGQSRVTVNDILVLRENYDLSIVKTVKNDQTSYIGRLTFDFAPDKDSVISIDYIKDWSILNAVDRIFHYYNPGTRELGKDLSQLMTGIDYGGVIVTGYGFEVGGGWDVLPFYSDKWDSYTDNFDEIIFVADDDQHQFIIREEIPTPIENEIYNVYFSKTDSYVSISDGEQTEYYFEVTNIFPPKVVVTKTIGTLGSAINPGIQGIEATYNPFILITSITSNSIFTSQSPHGLLPGDRIQSNNSEFGLNNALVYYVLSVISPSQFTLSERENGRLLSSFNNVTNGSIQLKVYSLGNILKLADISGIEVGMTVVGTGFSSFQTVLSIDSITKLVRLSFASNTAPSGTLFFSFNSAGSKILKVTTSEGIAVGDTVSVQSPVPISLILDAKTTVVSISGNDIELSNIIYRNIPPRSTVTFIRELVQSNEVDIDRSGVVSLSEPLVIGSVISITTELEPIRIDGENVDSIMQPIVMDGVIRVFNIPESFEINSGDVITFRKTTSDGSIEYQESDYDTALIGGDLAYSTATGLLADDIIVDGDGFVTPTSSSAPEEVIPGQIVDSVAIKVYDESVIKTVTVKVDTYTADGDNTLFAITQKPNSNRAVIVKFVIPFYDQITKQLQTTVEIKKIHEDFEIDYNNSTIAFIQAPDEGTTVSIISFGFNGENVIDLGYFIVDPTINEYITYGRWVDSNTSLVYVNGSIAEYEIFKTSTNLIGIRIAQVLNEGDVINYVIVEGTDQTFSIATTERIMTNGLLEYTLESKVGNTLPFESNMIVQVDNTILNGPNTSYFTISNNRLNYQVSPDKITIGSVNINDIIVYADEVELKRGVDYTIDMTTLTIKITKTIYKKYNKKQLIISISQNQGYIFIPAVGLSPAKIRFSKEYTSDNVVNVTSFYRHDIMDIRREKFNVTYSNSLVQNSVEYYDYVGIRNGQIQLEREVLNDYYVWILINGTLLTQSIDYKLNDDRKSIFINRYIDASDEITVITLAGSESNNNISYMQFKDMLNRVHFKRLNLNKQTVLTQDLYQTDIEIHVSDASKLGRPNPSDNRPGVIEIRGERIEYFSVEGNVLGRLRRGTLGTGVPNVHKIGEYVQDIGASETIPYQDKSLIEQMISNGGDVIEIPFIPMQGVPAHTVDDWEYDSNFDSEYLQADDIEVFVGGYDISEEWTSERDYVVDEIVISGSYSYRCIENHKSSNSFSRDLSKWKFFIGDLRLKKKPYSVYNVNQDVTSDINFDADYVVDGTTNKVYLANSIPKGIQVTIIRKTGYVWETGNEIRFGTSDISRFLQDVPGIKYSGITKY